MFDIGWSELGVIALVALIVIGPKDLPKVMREAGRWVRKARSLAYDFQRGVDDMARESELDDIKRGIETVSSVKNDLKGKVQEEVRKMAVLPPKTPPKE